jgi:hypothetical protein
MLCSETAAERHSTKVNGVIKLDPFGDRGGIVVETQSQIIHNASKYPESLSLNVHPLESSWVICC